MSRKIIKLGDYYFEYSTVVDAPVTWGMTLKDFEAYYLFEYGRSSIEDFIERMKRVEEKGTSSLTEDGAESTMEYNCAGPNGKNLTTDEIYKLYCLREPIS